VEFTQALKFTDQVLNDPSAEQIPLLDRVNDNCRLAEEMIAAMMELTNSNSMGAYKRASNHYRVIIAIWLLLNDPDILNQLKH